MNARGARAACLSAAAVLAFASGAGAAPKDEELIRSKLRERFPDVAIVDVRPAPVAGLYEVFTGDRIVYVDPKAEHLILGRLLETATRKDLSAAHLDDRMTIDFSTLPREQAITVVKGDGSRHLAIFSDPDCPYCQELEKALESISNVTIHTFLYPLANLHPEAPAKAVAIWCSPDRAAAYRAWMLERKVLEGAACNDDPVVELQALGQKLRINSTPTLFLADGRRVSGALPAAKLDELLGTVPAAGTE